MGPFRSDPVIRSVPVRSGKFTHRSFFISAYIADKLKSATMTDMSTTNGKPKLPPLTANTTNEDGTPKKKKVVKKKKKPAENGETPKEPGQPGEEPKPTPRKKKPASASLTTEGGGETTAPKKKKRVAKPSADQEGPQSSARSAASASQGEVGPLLLCSFSKAQVPGHRSMYLSMKYDYNV